MSPKEIIADTLFHYRLGRAGTDKKATMRPWGIEHSELRADAVIRALRLAGWGIVKIPDTGSCGSISSN